MLDKVKGALGLEDDEIDENILEYCSLDPAVGFLIEAFYESIAPLALLYLIYSIRIPSAHTSDPGCTGHQAEGKNDAG